MCVNVVVAYTDGGGIARTLCLIMINLAIQAGGPLSRTGLPVRNGERAGWHLSNHQNARRTEGAQKLTQRDPHNGGFVVIKVFISGRQPREDKTQHDGERDRQPPHLHKVHVVKGGRKVSLGRRAVRRMGVSPLTGSTESRGGQVLVSKKDKDRWGKSRVRAVTVSSLGPEWRTTDGHVRINKSSESSHREPEMASIHSRDASARRPHPCNPRTRKVKI